MHLFERDDPGTPARIGRWLRTLGVLFLALTAGTVAAALHASSLGWPGELLAAVVIFGFLALCVLQVLRMLAAWRREVVAHQETPGAR